MAVSPEKALTTEQVQAVRRRRRNIALALALVGVVVLFYVLTIVKMGPGVFSRPL
jgi:hypothetical protein